ncbi:uncharacterized protein BCR38DRAFT_450332 [Pseudomassariella vexata]|uniref:Pentatricopeptide repeat protein n=1 Tax=Pseudomassariella vexata TaxID=1141098 RepID=A0A1Y2DCR7_9PEZI|nr:uncharacterized protein BCR38DRAFT_450332 [Pseudomassariella vexata]ORY56906.1 hypothetical protein BCR38DRAFT_450332 [Pseudomassariella vexata]
MKISVRIDGSIYGAILSTRQSQSSSPRAVFLPTTQHNVATKLQLGNISVGRWRPRTYGADNTIQGRFKVKISGSSHYSTITNRGSRRPLNSYYFTSHAPQSHCRGHTSSAAPSDLPPKALAPPARSKEELLTFVDQYDDCSVEEHLEFLRDPYMRRYAPPDAPKLVVSDRVQVASPAPDEVESLDDEDQDILTKLRSAVFQKLLRPHSTDLDTIYELYRSLPDQRIPYIPARLRHALLAVFGITERKNPKAMLRYFAVVADVKNSGYTLTRTQWNTAISFASRYVGSSTEVEAEAALHLWREMEHDAGIKGNEATFNILFDVASKAGKFSLAEMIYQEMSTRGFQFNRYHHVSLIHFFGLKMDASGVRAAYREMVEAGEIIDSIVLNCVIAGLVRAGEEDSAERIYVKMKASDERHKIMPDRNYVMQKQITRVLMMFARFGRANPEMQPGFQGTAMVSPDLHTYQILINHHGVRLGKLSAVAKYLDEMKYFRVPLHGSIFLALFKSFHLHGATGSDWSLQRLEGVWGAFLEAFDDGANGLYISTWMAMWVLRAFLKCSQSRDRVLDVYEDLSARWDLDAEGVSFMLEFLHKLLQKSNLSVYTRPSLPQRQGGGNYPALGARSLGNGNT